MGRRDRHEASDPEATRAALAARKEAADLSRDALQAEIATRELEQALAALDAGPGAFRRAVGWTLRTDTDAHLFGKAAFGGAAVLNPALLALPAAVLTGALACDVVAATARGVGRLFRRAGSDTQPPAGPVLDRLLRAKTRELERDLAAIDALPDAPGLDKQTLRLKVVRKLQWELKGLLEGDGQA